MAAKRQRKACPRVPREVAAAFAYAKKAIAEASLDSYCLEASALMVRKLPGAIALRRDLGGDEGHWTVEYDGVEYDPTISYWLSGRPRDAIQGCLYIVNDSSPHDGWPITETTESPSVEAEVCSLVEHY